MKSIKTAGSRFALVAIALTLVVAYAAAQGAFGSLDAGTSEAALTGRSSQAIEAEVAIAHANPIPVLEDALAAAYGGAWFDASTAQMHVGVTSLASRRKAVEVAENLGIADYVTETAVSSTRDELEAAQRRWNHRLAPLLGRGKVSTALAAQSNSVEVELGTTVSDSKHAALRRLGAEDDVDVSISVASSAHLGVELEEKRCSAFTAGTARCETPIVSGVTIESEKVGGKIYVCTAGPPVVRKNPTTLKEKTEVFILTAGHCIESGGGTKKWWSAYKQNVKEEPPLIGKATHAIYPKTDIGVIEVGNPGHWTSAGSIPITPTVALWEGKETEPANITGETEPMEGLEVCISGQTSGVTCGEIDKTNVTSEKTENLVKVKGMTPKTTAVGDSGGPWYAKGSPSLVIGVHKGHFESNEDPVFHSLKVSFEKLKEQKGIDLELLTKGEEIRHPTVTGDKYPVTFSAKDVASEDLLAVMGTSLECEENEFHGELSEAKQLEEPSVIELTPVYSDCRTAGGLPVKFTHNECKYRLTLTDKVGTGHYEGDVGIACPEGKSGFEFHIYNSHADYTTGDVACELTVSPQLELQEVTLTNSGGDIVIDAGAVEGIDAEVSSAFCICTGGDTETTSGVYDHDTITLSGASGGAEVEIDMAGE